MSDAILWGVGAVAIVALTNGYWIRRYRTALDGLETAREWEEKVPQQTQQPETQAMLHEAAEAASVKPENLTEEIERLITRADSLEDRVETMRDAWARSWWECAQHEAVATDTTEVVICSIPDGHSEDARAFAREALTYDALVAIVLAEEDGSFAVGVGEYIAERYPATEVASQIAKEAGRGGSSGSQRLAAGGGADTDTLEMAAKKVRDRILSDI
ncbi:DHH family phosphoesterase [Haloarcula montana]|uniref:DHH family phosphoesterase n=1 Tax=Haloarcula montana TaxID=3111776 RepID=UPI002D77930C|nr:DHH family phosphoesterase [Haloarcula sp. GH36]